MFGFGTNPKGTLEAPRGTLEAPKGTLEAPKGTLEAPKGTVPFGKRLARTLKLFTSKTTLHTHVCMLRTDCKLNQFVNGPPV